MNKFILSILILVVNLSMLAQDNLINALEKNKSDSAKKNFSSLPSMILKKLLSKLKVSRALAGVIAEIHF